MKDAINTLHVMSILPLSISWNHCHCVGDRLVAQPLPRRGEKAGTAPLVAVKRGWVMF